MKKESAKATHHHPTRSPGEKEQVSHLDEALTEITTTTAHRLKKLGKPVLVVLAILVVAQGAYALWNSIYESKETELNQRLYELVDSPASKAESYEPSEAAISSLLRDVEGIPLERNVLQSIGNFYLDRADRLAAKKSEAAPSLDAASTTPPPTVPAVSPEVLTRLEEKALELATKASTQWASDPELQRWVSGVRARIEGQRKKSWLPPPRQFRPPLPGTVPPAAGASAVPPAGSTAPAVDREAVRPEAVPPGAAPPAAAPSIAGPAPAPLPETKPAEPAK